MCVRRPRTCSRKSGRISRKFNRKWKQLSRLYPKSSLSRGYSMARHKTKPLMQHAISAKTLALVNESCFGVPWFCLQFNLFLSCQSPYWLTNQEMDWMRLRRPTIRKRLLICRKEIFFGFANDHIASCRTCTDSAWLVSAVFKRVPRDEPHPCGVAPGARGTQACK